MHKLIEIKKVLKKLDANGDKLTKTARELNINLHTLRSWQDKRRENVPLIKRGRSKTSNCTSEEKKKVIDYYFKHGNSIIITCRNLANLLLRY